MEKRSRAREDDTEIVMSSPGESNGLRSHSFLTKAGADESRPGDRLSIGARTMPSLQPGKGAPPGFVSFTTPPHPLE
jgi:hypothetical protein